MSDAEIKKVFQEYAAFGKPATAKGRDTDMTGKNFVKMCKDKKLVDKSGLTTTEIDMIYTKCTKGKGKAGKSTLTFDTFKEALELCSKSKYKKATDVDDCLTKLKGLVIQGDGPATAGTTKTSTKGGVDRMTDTSKYTGSHKERFDESGKGKGKAGRDDLAAQTGYVGAYKGEGTYEKKVAGEK